MSPPPSSKKHGESGAARIAGSASSGVLELLLFHPVDTVAKRLMSHQGKVLVPGSSMSEKMASMGQVVFKKHAQDTLLRRYMSLFPGLGFAAGYKISQRVYKFGGQPFVKDYLQNNHASLFTNSFGERYGKMLMYATAGSIVGIGEVALLPLDVLKIKQQTNPEALRGRGIMQIVREEGLGLYRGGMWTAARNAPGSFALFGGSAFVKEFIFRLEDYNSATVLQNALASVGGAVASITVAAPLDVVKTRIQNRNFDDPTSGVKVIQNMLRKEGFSAFFKGLTPKILVVGPKLIFSYTIAQSMIPIFSQWF
ncbi:MAG: mitochondrial carrier domain-containing protein [Piptocephalis tieghemiana]|nr:MAG: mitochondrial carrier domain-containing protein [Piptocephalis tieghemiana]